MNVTKPQLISAAIAVAIAIAAMTGFVWSLNAHAGQVFLLGALIFLILAGCALWLFSIFRRRNLQNLELQLRGSLNNVPAQIAKPSDRALIADLRRKFDQGLEAFKSTGKNVYDVPWYLVVGESGGGKTEAIRHSGLPFPADLNNFFQGVGGTFNMSWWFSSRCVLLDTAGRMVFDAYQPGAASEWVEFLKMLRKARVSCPINGLVMFIPVDTLICDSPENIREKTGRLHYQLRVIQQNLGVRFPVYVIVSKADRLTGFREWVSSWPNQDRKGSIFGWSNSHDLDEDFSTDWIEEMYDSLLPLCRNERDLAFERLVKSGSKDLSAIYALPHSLALLKPRLKYYLENIFVRDASGANAPLPPFLRGIYFTSAMTEGAVLDADLSEASGVPADEIGDTKAASRDVSYFLSDLFTRKIFPENGMVTPASGRVDAYIRIKRSLLLGVLLFCIGGVGYSFYTMARDLNHGVNRSYRVWSSAAAGWTNENYWNPLWIGKDAFDTEYIYRGGMSISAGNGSTTLAGLHQKLGEDARNGIVMPDYAFGAPKAQSSVFTNDMRQAQIALVRRSVIAPLMDAARKILSDADSPWSSKKQAALASIMEMERQIHVVSQGGSAPGLEKIKEVLGPLSLLVSGKDIEPSITELIDTTFRDKFERFWACPEVESGKTLAENAAIEQALRQVQRQLTSEVDRQAKAAKALDAFFQDLSSYDKIEREFIGSVQAAAPGDEDLISRFDELARAHRAAIISRDRYMDSMREAGFEPARFNATLTQGAKVLLAGREAAVVNDIKEISSALKVSAGQTPLELQIIERLEEVRKSLTGSGKGGISFTNQAGFPEIDATCLRRDQLEKPAFTVRFEIFKQASDIWSSIPDTRDSNRVPLSVLLESLYRASVEPKKNLEKYRLDRPLVVRVVAEKIIEEALRQKTLVTVRSRAKNVWRPVFEQIAFPIATGAENSRPVGVAEIISFHETLQSVRNDLEAMRFNRFFSTQKVQTEALIASIDRTLSWMGFLVGDGRDPLTITLRIPEINRQRTILGKAGITDFSAHYAGDSSTGMNLENDGIKRNFPKFGQDDKDLVAFENVPLDKLIPNGELLAPNRSPLQISAPAPYFFLAALGGPLAAHDQVIIWDDKRLYWITQTTGQSPRFFAFELVLNRILPARDQWPSAASVHAVSEAFFSSL